MNSIERLFPATAGTLALTCAVYLFTQLECENIDKRIGKALLISATAAICMILKNEVDVMPVRTPVEYSARAGAILVGMATPVVTYGILAENRST